MLALLPLLLLLLGSPFVVGIHHHADASSTDSCPVCVHAATPGIGAADGPAAPAPALREERPRVFVAWHPADVAARFVATRGPPSA